ncbi:MAG: aldehyde dehydrogenase family protein [Pseudomonadales bacterium]
MNKYFATEIAGCDAPLKKRTVISPFDGSTVGEIDLAGASHVEQALVNAYALFRNRRAWLSLQQRINVLENLAALMEQQKDELARLAAMEGGKPLIDSRVEVDRAINGIKICIETISSEAGARYALPEADPRNMRFGFTSKEPVGVVVAVSAFNHPLNLIVHQVAAAVAAGCPVIVKPADDTPLSCFNFASLLTEAGLPMSWCQALVPKKLELATALVSDPRVGFFSFIGSAKVGWMLRTKLAAGTRCALEHGGAAPVIVDATADLNKVIPSLLKGGYYHSGQVCVSVQRVFVHELLLDELADKLATVVQQLRVGDPLDDSTELGPLIRPAEVKRVAGWVQEAVDAGATLLAGGDVLPNNCYQPTLLLEPPANCAVSSKEIFGPVVCLYSYRDVDDAIARANSLDVAFQAAVFTQDVDRAFEAYQQLDAAAVMVNDHTAFRHDAMPFAGLRHSGLAVGGIPFTIEDMQIDKLFVLKTQR